MSVSYYHTPFFQNSQRVLVIFMKTIGIIAEYNPFHRGHLAQYEMVRQRFGKDAVIVTALGSSFTQRGEPSRYTKFARAEAAVRCGADLVLELPLPWAASSAEGFARGGTAILNALGCVDVLAFGSECGDGARLARLTDALLDEAWQDALHRNLEQGMGFAPARQLALETLLGEPVPELQRRNDILALEYLKALRQQGSEMIPCPLPRRTELPPASALRQQADFFDALPPAAAEVFCRERLAGREVMPDALDNALLYRLRTMQASELDAREGGGEGLGNRLCRAALREGTAEAVLRACVTKRYPASRLRRLMLAALLEIPAGMNRSLPTALRVLALNDRGAALLHGAKPSLPVITRAAKREPDRFAALEERASAVYALGFSDPAQRSAALEFQSPFFLKT